MLFIKTKEIKGQGIVYQTFGSGKISLVIEMGLGSTIGEWWHIAEQLSEQYTVLLYQRGRNIFVPRTPQNIAAECHELLCSLPHEEKIVLLAHSQGGLYAQQFVRNYPEMVKALVLLDPLSANDAVYKTVFPTPEEQRKSGFDKSENFRMMRKLVSMHLGFLIKAMMKKAPPFYYYPDFSKEARAFILTELTKVEYHDAALEEYRLAHESQVIETLREKADFPDIPLTLITHGSMFEVSEIMEFGQTTKGFAWKVENLWQSLMQEYLTFSSQSRLLRSEQSGHYIHLSDMAVIEEALRTF